MKGERGFRKSVETFQAHDMKGLTYGSENWYGKGNTYLRKMEARMILPTSKTLRQVTYPF